jgi:NAD(P)-dependent dehydrogenase (short-subunit alcohol dehydrogenase family)
MSRLAGRSAIVTGGAVGIGWHYSQALADAGAQVVIADIVEGGEAADAIAAKHGRDAAISVTCDVSDENSVKQLVDRAVERFGKIDILVNNAAIFAQIKPTLCIDLDVETWDKVMAVNVRGPFLMAKHVAPHMMARRYGKIINIGSGSAARGMPEMLHYVSSKGAILGFTRALCRELGGYNICVNTLAPGYTLSDTALQNVTHVEQSRTISIQRRAIKRDQYPEDLLGALVFLASSDSDFITGQTIAVDGGATNT